MGTRTPLFSRNQPGGMFTIENQSLTTGDNFFVHSGTGTDGAGYGKNPDSPCATLDYAVGLCTASKGDRIYVMPGHAENLSGGTSLTMDVIGVQVIGLGTGRLKPQFTITAAAGTWNVTVANCHIENVDIVSNFLNIASAMTVGASADGLTLRNVNFYDTSAILGALIDISIAALCSDVTIEGCKFYGVALTAPATNVVLCAGAADRLTIRDCFCKGEFSDGIIVATVAASVDMILQNLLLYNLSTSGKGVNLHANTTGVAHDVLAYLADNVGSEPAITGAAMLQTDRVRQTNVITASPFLCIAADS